MTACGVVLKRDAGVLHCVLVDAAVGVMREPHHEPVAPTRNPLEPRDRGGGFVCDLEHMFEHTTVVHSVVWASSHI